MKRFIKLMAVVGLMLAAVSTQAASGTKTFPLTANTVSNFLSGQYVIQNITLIASTTNITTVKVFDSSNTATTMVINAYTKYNGYATNYSTVFTNANGVYVTNSYSGWYTAPVAVSGSTSTRPIVYTLMAPGSMITSKDVNIGTLTGLALVPDQNCIVAISYIGNP